MRPNYLPRDLKHYRVVSPIGDAAVVAVCVLAVVLRFIGVI